jgi:hypothetical protein
MFASTVVSINFVRLKSERWLNRCHPVSNTLLPAFKIAAVNPDFVPHHHKSYICKWPQSLASERFLIPLWRLELCPFTVRSVSDR